MTLESLSNDLKEIIEYVQCVWNEKSAEELTSRLTNLSIYLSRTAEMQAEAKMILQIKEGEIADMLCDTYSATTMKIKIAKGASAENRLYTLVERTNAAITHQIDAIRSQLSFLKVDMDVSRYQR